MSAIQVLIGGHVLSQAQADAVLMSAEILFQRSQRFLKDYVHWKEEKVKEHKNCYLRAAEIIHLFKPHEEFLHIRFVDGRAELKDRMEVLFGPLSKHNQEGHKK